MRRLESRRGKMGVALALVALALAILPAAVAAKGGAVHPETAVERPATKTSEGENGVPDLPFTAADIAAIALVGVSLLAAGAAVRRLT